MREIRSHQEWIACMAILPAVPSGGHDTETSRQHLAHFCAFQLSIFPFPA